MVVAIHCKVSNKIEYGNTDFDTKTCELYKGYPYLSKIPTFAYTPGNTVALENTKAIGSVKNDVTDGDSLITPNYDTPRGGVHGKKSANMENMKEIK